MTIGLAIFTRRYLDQADALDAVNRRINSSYLRQATQEGLALLKSGQAAEKLQQYVESTQRHAG